MPYIQEPIPLVSTPPMSQWSMLQLPWTGEVTEIKHVNMRTLRELVCDYTQITSLPWDELGNLQYLYIYGCAFVTLELWQMPNLYSCYAGDNYNLVMVDAHDAPTHPRHTMLAGTKEELEAEVARLKLKPQRPRRPIERTPPVPPSREA